MASQKWSDKEVSFLQRNYGKLSVADIAKELGRSKYSVESKAAALRKVEVTAPADDSAVKTTVVHVQAKKAKVAKVVINKPKTIGEANPAFSGEDREAPTALPTHSVKKKRGIFGRIFG